MLSTNENIAMDVDADTTRTGKRHLETKQTEEETRQPLAKKARISRKTAKAATTALPTGDDHKIPERKYPGPGMVMTFGTGESGALGLSLRRERKKPCVVPGLEPTIQFIASRSLNTAAVDSKHQLLTWGCDDDGALGRPIETEEDAFTPQVVPGLEGHKIVDVKLGACHTVLATAEGKVFTFGQYRSGNGGVEFAPGVKVRPTPTPVAGMEDKEVVMLAAGMNADFALTSTGEVYWWGPRHTRVSSRFKYSIWEPQRILFPSSARGIKAIWSTDYTHFAQDTAGSVYVWGLNNFGQAGVGHTKAVSKPTLARWPNGVVKVVGGVRHTLVLCEDGTVYSTGGNDNGELARQCEKHGPSHFDTKLEPVPSLSPSQLPGDERVVDIESGEAHCLAVTSTGRAFAWGLGVSLQLGTGTDDDEPFPKQILGQQLTEANRVVLAAAGGSQHTVLLCRDP